VTVLKRFFVPLGILTLGLIGFEGQSFIVHSTFAQAQNMSTIPISLPENLTLNLKSQGTISGLRLLEFNANTRQIKVGQGSKIVNQNIANIESMEFSGSAKIKGGKIVIRGEGNTGSSCSNQESWNLPLNALNLKDSNQAELTISSLPKNKQTEIRQIQEDRTYVGKEIKFETKDKFTLKTTPCSSNE
jgi:hypothetical protein